MENFSHTLHAGDVLFIQPGFSMRHDIYVKSGVDMSGAFPCMIVKTYHRKSEVGFNSEMATIAFGLASTGKLMAYDILVGDLLRFVVQQKMKPVNVTFTNSIGDANKTPTTTKIIFNDPATIVFWDDGTKTVVKRSAKTPFDEHAAYTAALAKKLYKSNSAVHRLVDSVKEYQKPKEKPKKSKAKAKTEEKPADECKAITTKRHRRSSRTAE